MNLAIGDESTLGYDPKALNPRTESKALSKALGDKVISDGRKGASLTIKGKSNVLHQIDQFSLPAYDRIFLFYGINDYLHSDAKLMAVGKALTKAIQAIRNKNHYIQIYGILPLPMYDKKGRSLAVKQNAAGYTLKSLIDMLSITYANNYVKTLNWLTMIPPIVNQHNYKQRLIDGRYPTEETYQRMADKIGAFVQHTDKHMNPRFRVASEVKTTKPDQVDKNAMHFKVKKSKWNRNPKDKSKKAGKSSKRKSNK